VQNPFLVGSLVYLRPLEREDVPALVAWLNDPEVTRTVQRYEPLTRRGEEEYLARVEGSATDLLLGIAARQEDRLVGVTGLHHIDWRNRHAGFGIAVGDKAAWGRGYGTEATRLLVRHAFETLNLNRVWLHVYEHNERGLRLYRKVGFRPEGRLRQDAFREGRYWDTVVMGVLRDEWEAVDYAPEPPGG
jgi:RimJ/RimL family protein N-acetyltransferase